MTKPRDSYRYVPYRQNPKLYEVTPETFTTMILDELPDALRALAEQHRALLEPIASKLLAAERTKRRGRAIESQRQKETHKGRTTEVMREEVEIFDTPDEAKRAVIHMAEQLAMLPPPSPKHPDDVGFAGTTDRPMRTFLARVMGGEPVPDSDYLKAARLLIVHSKTQLPRARVMGAVRKLEEAVPKAPKLPAGARKPLTDDYSIIDPRKGKGQDRGKGTTAWEWDGGARVVIQIPNNLRYDEARRTLRGEGVQAQITVQGDSYRLNMPVSGIPQLAEWLRGKGAPKGAARLLSAWEAWTAAPGVGGDLGTPVALPGASPTEAQAHQPAGPPPPDLDRGHAAPQDRRSGGLSDFDAVKWDWDGGPTIKLALSMVKESGRWVPVAREVERTLLDAGKHVGETETRPRPGSRYKDYFTEYSIEDVDAIADILDKKYRRSQGPDKLRELGKWWRARATERAPEATPEAAPEAKSPLARARKGSMRDTSWEFDPESNAIRLKLPYDSDRSRTDQLVAALREAAIPHSRFADHSLLFSTENMERVLTLMGEQGRYMRVLPTLREQMGGWRALEAEHAPKPTKDDVLADRKLLR